MYTYTPPPPGAGARIGSMLLDHILMTLVAMLFGIPVFIGLFAGALDVRHEPGPAPSFTGGVAGYVFLLGFALYFCKDSIGGRSLAKRITGQQVVVHATGAPAPPLRCLVRNLFCVLWPIEVLVTLGSPRRRLGDLVAGTRVQAYAATAEKPPVALPQAVLSVLLAWGLLAAVMALLPDAPRVSPNSFSATSYNAQKSRELQQAFTDSMGAYLRPDIRVYDSSGGQARPYVSLILRLKRDYLEDKSTYGQLHDHTRELVYARYPEEEMSGRVQYIYQDGASFRSTSTSLGTNELHATLRKKDPQ